MEELDYWRLCEELNIVQAALLVVGVAPTQAEHVENWDVEKRPEGYEAAKTAITTGLKNFIHYENEVERVDSMPPSSDSFDDHGDYLRDLAIRSIEGKLVPQSDYDINGNNLGYIEDTTDLYKSTVKADSLKQWLRLKGFATGFFFPEPVETMDFLDPQNPRYALKLAAAVRAWQAVKDPGKKSAKQALDKWLREHAAEYGLTNDEGNPIEKAIEEISKVANWKPAGGAPKTPT